MRAPHGGWSPRLCRCRCPTTPPAPRSLGLACARVWGVRAVSIHFAQRACGWGAERARAAAERAEREAVARRVTEWCGRIFSRAVCPVCVSHLRVGSGCAAGRVCPCALRRLSLTPKSWCKTPFINGERDRGIERYHKVCGATWTTTKAGCLAASPAAWGLLPTPCERVRNLVDSAVGAAYRWRVNRPPDSTDGSAHLNCRSTGSAVLQ